MKPKIKRIAPYALVIEATDSDTGYPLERFENYKALVTEVVSEEGQVEGTLLYVPGVTVEHLLGKNI